MMYKDLIEKNKNIAVIGLGYVGLPLALSFAKKFRVIGFDTNASRVQMMNQKVDPSKELRSEDFEDISFTSDAANLKKLIFLLSLFLPQWMNTKSRI